MSTISGGTAPTAYTIRQWRSEAIELFIAATTSLYRIRTTTKAAQL